ncbi:MAG: metallophosphoesterase family protein [Oceanospirillaceae bacterium]|nr:metallophosphoesterase family protein [Oceanospirillaceae bacterium]
MKPLLVGVLSDTHGLLRPEALEALRDCDHILHAGDIGREDVIHRLKAIAPLTAIRGNVDRDAWAYSWPDTAELELAGCNIYMLHNLHELDFDPATEGFDVVVSGHSHKPHHYEKDGVLYLNPGSTGPRRFSLPIALARLTLVDSTISAEMLTLG